MIFGHYYKGVIDFVVAEYNSATCCLTADGRMIFGRYKGVIDFVVAEYNSATCCLTADGRMIFGHYKAITIKKRINIGYKNWK